MRRSLSLLSFSSSACHGRKFCGGAIIFSIEKLMISNPFDANGIILDKFASVRKRLKIHGGYREVEDRRNKGGCCHGLMARNHQFCEEKREKKGQGGNFQFSVSDVNLGKNPFLLARHDLGRISF
ncbi:hypothetical protein RIF29_15616 [Crotalaria pallida]|uniref:Uncharacterized protein n=1 Tax=Crotalaria pallida TaxID=3830 RepID=A0AAN9IBB7_CROPI